jgi:hypothetical protein
VPVRPVVKHRRLAAEGLVAGKRMPNWTSSAALVESVKAPAMQCCWTKSAEAGEGELW